MRNLISKKKITDDSVFSESAPTVESEASEKRWYLGIDIGSTGLSAVLLDYDKQCLYPISWHGVELGQDSSPCFRLPTTVLLVPHGVDNGNGFRVIPEWGLSEQTVSPTPSIPLKSRALVMRVGQHKDMLNITIPHYAAQTQRWEPEVQQGSQSITEHRSYPLALSGFYQALKSLLATLTPTPAVTLPSPSSDTPNHPLTFKVWGLDRSESHHILQHLTGVIVGYPASWSAAYRFNVREAILGARLVARASQIIMVNDAIATLLSQLPSADGTPVTFPDILAQAPLQTNADYSGVTLVINGGATTTELAIAHVSSSVAAFPAPTASSPPSTAKLHLKNMVFRSLAYGGNAMDQDIISQLLYPRLAQADKAPIHHSQGAGTQSPASSQKSSSPQDSSASQDSSVSSWLQSLDVEHLDLPSVGEPDPHNRQILQKQLHQSSLGSVLLRQARTLKLDLQHQAIASVTMANQQWQVRQDELGNRILLPYVQRLHREVNALLDQAKLEPDVVRHVTCSGGTASLRFIAVWLQKTFPNATISQDVFQGDRTSTLDYNVVPTCSRVAYGLAALPLHPRIVDWTIRQPCEYDFLMELGRILPDRPLTLREMLELLERRGINPVVSHPCVVSLLEGKLPAGLVPQGIHANVLTPESQHYHLYQQLLSTPLFSQVDAQTYHPNRHQWVLLQQYLSALTAGTRQTLFQPQVGMAVSL
ncbi:MAG: hypothetical protein F6K09_12805 [Merismopedia sp. SIO2A8]|nr:hypothetical protein [Merismopedia sp. SIO2A8]